MFQKNITPPSSVPNKPRKISSESMWQHCLSKEMEEMETQREKVPPKLWYISTKLHGVERLKREH
jgi:hypothetical protein